MEKRLSHTLLVGMQTGAATVENKWNFLRKLKMDLPLSQRIYMHIYRAHGHRQQWSEGWGGGWGWGPGGERKSGEMEDNYDSINNKK